MEYERSIVKERGREGPSRGLSRGILMIRPPNSLRATVATSVWGLYRRFHDRVRILMPRFQRKPREKRKARLTLLHAPLAHPVVLRYRETPPLLYSSTMDVVSFTIVLGTTVRSRDFTNRFDLPCHVSGVAEDKNAAK